MSIWKPLTDVQWMNIVNHEQAYWDMSKDEAVHLAVKKTEAKLKEINGDPADTMLKDYSDMIRKICFEYAAGGYNSEGLLPVDVADAMMRWIIEDAREYQHKVEQKIIDRRDSRIEELENALLEASLSLSSKFDAEIAGYSPPLSLNDLNRLTVQLMAMGLSGTFDLGSSGQLVYKGPKPPLNNNVISCHVPLAAPLFDLNSSQPESAKEQQ